MQPAQQNHENQSSLVINLILCLALGLLSGCGDSDSGSSNGTTSGETTAGTSTDTTPYNPGTPDWDGADTPVTCSSGAQAVTLEGELDGAPVTLEATTNFSYSAGDGDEMVMDLSDLGTWIGIFRRDPEQSWATGVFRLSEEPATFYCANRGSTYTQTDNGVEIELRSIRSLGTCPGGEPVEGTISGCVLGEDEETCPDEVMAPGFAFDGGNLGSIRAGTIAFGVGLPGGHLFAPADGQAFMVVDDVFYCIESFTSSGRFNDPNGVQFTATGLTRLGDCDTAPSVGGYINICAP